MERELTKNQAFDAMKNFLEGYWKLISKPKDIGLILKNITISFDETTFKSSILNDWDKAVALVSQKNTLTKNQAFDAMRNFLDDYWRRTGSDDVGCLLSGIAPLDNGDIVDSAFLSDWDDAVEKVFASKQ